MDLNSTGKLLSRIAIHYPVFRRHITDESGKIIRAVGEEWYRRLGYLELDEALRLLDRYLDQPEEARKSPPDTSWFTRSEKSEKKDREARASYRSEGAGPYMVSPDGTLTNDEGMRFAYPGLEDLRFYYTYRGDIAYRDESGREIVSVPYEVAYARRHAWRADKKAAIQ